MSTCKNEDDCPTPMWCRGKDRCPKSDGAHCAVAGGSLPVSSVLALIGRWSNNAAQWESDVKYHKRPIFKDNQAATISVASCEARASIYAVCIQDLRAEMARENVRQPEENIGGVADARHPGAEHTSK